MKHLRTIARHPRGWRLRGLDRCGGLRERPALLHGPGFTDDGTTWSLNDQRCGVDGKGVANDGGTGQFASNGFVPGDPYLVWVLTANGARKSACALVINACHQLLSSCESWCTR